MHQQQVKKRIYWPPKCRGLQEIKDKQQQSGGKEGQSLPSPTLGLDVIGVASE